ncbi:MAG: DJ-1/PfpI family protein [Patescibacteria group bacterium]|nr:DJ-1/PfpI family protein [Patescibacteria group bacterium]
MNPKVAIVVAQADFRDEEFLQTREILQRFGFMITVVSETLEPAHGKFGAIALPNLTLQELRAKDFDALVLIGGPGVRKMFAMRTVLRRVQEFARAGKVVAAICSAPTILANAGLLMGKRATAYPTEETALRDRGAEYTGFPVESDGVLITAKDSTYTREFAERIVWALGE